ncbi:hypothetical protein PO002_44490 [Cupriavidus necator]|uniref:DUF6988 family protein n=1 Tax=Cupriavidus necator TaxID=106590 RepID=UPI0039C2902E
MAIIVSVAVGIPCLQAGEDVKSVEHAAGAVALLTIGMPNAAMALFRPQFETLIRGVWLLEAAGEKWVRQYHEPLTEESARAADKAPGVKVMFDELLKLEDPRVKGIVAHLARHEELHARGYASDVQVWYRRLVS